MGSFSQPDDPTTETAFPDPDPDHPVRPIRIGQHGSCPDYHSRVDFLAATAVGKIPSISLEVLISYNLTHVESNYIRLGITLIILALGFFIWKRGRWLVPPYETK